MKITFRRGPKRFRLTATRESRPACDFLEFKYRSQAVSFLNDILTGQADMREMRDMLGDLGYHQDMSRIRDSEIIELLAQDLVSGRIRVETSSAPGKTMGGSLVAPVEKEPETPWVEAEPTSQKSWIGFVVVDNFSGQPVSGACLDVRLPDGHQSEYVTDGKGLIDIRNIAPGECQVRRDLGEATVIETYAMVSLSRNAVQHKTMERVNPISAKPEIAMARPYRVRTGDSLESVARDAGLTWKKLAHFNWGTSDPEEINDHLRDKMGCRRRTRDGRNYIFDSDDTPGLLYIPYPLLKTGLRTDGTHVLQVQSTAVLFDYAFEREGDQVNLSFSIQGAHPRDLKVRVYEGCNLNSRREREALISKHAPRWGDRQGYRKSGEFIELGPGDNLTSVADRYGFSKPEEIFDHFLNDELREWCPQASGLQEGDSLYIPQKRTLSAIPLGPLLEVEETGETVSDGKRYRARWSIQEQAFDLLDPERWMPENRADLSRPGNWGLDGKDAHGGSQYLPQFAVLTPDFQVLGVSPTPLWLVNKVQVEKLPESTRTRVFFTKGQSRDAPGNESVFEPFEEPFAFFGAQP